jgi:hypothetical protein
MSLEALVRFVCEKCGRKLSAKPSLLGRTAECPDCGNALEIALPMVRQPGPAGDKADRRVDAAAHAPPPTGGPDRVRAAPQELDSVNVFLGWVTAVCLITAFVSGCMWFNAVVSSPHRFADDNAFGATANTLEFFRNGGGKSVAEWVIAALLCQVIAAVRNVSREVRESAASRL